MVKRFSFLFAVLIIVCAGMFSGCNHSSDNNDASLIGTWKSVYDEVFVITKTDFTSKFGDTVFYSGTIKNIRDEGGGAGYITIQYTECPPAGLGKYYVIHYKNLTSSSMELAGAGKVGDPDFDNFAPGGKAKQADAEALYTVQNGYFGVYSGVSKQ